MLTLILIILWLVAWEDDIKISEMRARYDIEERRHKEVLKKMDEKKQSRKRTVRHYARDAHGRFIAEEITEEE